MKKQMLSQLAVLALLLFFGSLRVHAQSQERLMTVEVPFEFQINDKVLPPGNYVIKRDSQIPQLLLIQNPEHKIWMAVHTLPLNETKQQAHPTLKFKEYGGEHFLSEVNFSGYGFSYSLFQSKTERKLAKLAKPRMIPNGDSTAN